MKCNINMEHSHFLVYTQNLHSYKSLIGNRIYRRWSYVKRQELKYIFINPNTQEDTTKALQKIIVDKILQLDNNRKMQTTDQAT